MYGVMKKSVSCGLSVRDAAGVDGLEEGGHVLGCGEVVAASGYADEAYFGPLGEGEDGMAYAF